MRTKVNIWSDTATALARTPSSLLLVYHSTTTTTTFFLSILVHLLSSRFRRARDTKILFLNPPLTPLHLTLPRERSAETLLSVLHLH
ncbi:hypothetical protein LY76DRAFT_135141 [Colletotrichum caudatum]|nr:hypothetical protein LY76DRAFT_135141 [Colletotrichum caudatum]